MIALVVSVCGVAYCQEISETCIEMLQPRGIGHGQKTSFVECNSFLKS